MLMPANANASSPSCHYLVLAGRGFPDAVVAEAYYKKLIELRTSGAVTTGTGAAYALHEAVKVLREKVGEQNIVKWAPFVHFGV